MDNGYGNLGTHDVWLSLSIDWHWMLASFLDFARTITSLRMTW